MFLRLVIVGRDADDSRRRVRYDELLRHAPDRDAAARGLDDFTRGRLLTRDGDKEVVMTHEVPIRAWPRLRGWIEHDRSGNLVRQDVEEAAALWEQAGREAAALYRGNRLETALAWAGTHGPELSGAAQAFLAAAHHQRRGQRLRRAAVATITALAVLASLAAVFAFRQERHARDAATEALHSRDRAINAAVTSTSVQLAPTDPSLSAQLALTSYRMDANPDAASRLITTQNTPLDTRLPGPRGVVYTVAYSPDGHMLAAGNRSQNLVRLWGVSDPGRPVALGRPVPVDRSVNSILSLAFSPNGRVLAVGGHTIHNGDAGSGGFVDLWSLTSPSHPVLRGRLKSPGVQGFDAATSIEALAFSPDGRALVAGNQNKTVSLWNTADPNNPAPRGDPLTGAKDAVDAVAFSPDGRTLAAGDGGGNVTLWNTTDPNHPVRLPETLTGANELIFSLAFSPDCHTLAAAGDNENGGIALWDVSDPAHPESGPGIANSHTEFVQTLAFSRDGTMLAAGGDGSNGEVGLWSTTDPGTRIGEPIEQPATTSTWVAFSPDGRTLATGKQQGHRHPVERHRPPPPHAQGQSPDRARRQSVVGGVQPGRPHPRGGRPHRQRHHQPVERHRPRPPRRHRPAADHGHRIRGRSGVQPRRSHPGRHHRRRRGHALGPERRDRHQPYLLSELRRAEPAAVETIRSPTAVRPALCDLLGDPVRWLSRPHAALRDAGRAGAQETQFHRVLLPWLP